MNTSQTGPTLVPSPISPAATIENHETSEQQAARLARESSTGNLTSLRQVLAHTRDAQLWQQRVLLLDLVATSIPLDVLETACAIEPDAADLAVVRCAYYSAQTLAHRRDDAGQLTADGVRKAGECIRAAMTSLEAAARLDPADPTSFACIMSALDTFDQLKPVMQTAFQRATAIAPELIPFLTARQLSPATPRAN